MKKPTECSECGTVSYDLVEFFDDWLCSGCAIEVNNAIFDAENGEPDE